MLSDDRPSKAVGNMVRHSDEFYESMLEAGRESHKRSSNGFADCSECSGASSLKIVVLCCVVARSCSPRLPEARMLLDKGRWGSNLPQFEVLLQRLRKADARLACV